MIKSHACAAAACLALLLIGSSANADVRLINLSGKTFAVDLQLPAQRLKNLTLNPAFKTSTNFKTPPGERRYPLSIILKSSEGEWRTDGQDNGVYAIHQTNDGYEPQFMGYIKKDFDLDYWVKVWNSTQTPMTLELFYPNGDSAKRQLDPATDGYKSLTYAAFNSSDGPTAKPGEMRRFELKNSEGQILAKGTASLGQVYLLTGDNGGYAVEPVGFN